MAMLIKLGKLARLLERSGKSSQRKTGRGTVGSSVRWGRDTTWLETEGGSNSEDRRARRVEAPMLVMLLGGRQRQVQEQRQGDQDGQETQRQNKVQKQGSWGGQETRSVVRNTLRLVVNLLVNQPWSTRWSSNCLQMKQITVFPEFKSVGLFVS